MKCIKSTMNWMEDKRTFPLLKAISINTSQNKLEKKEKVIGKNKY